MEKVQLTGSIAAFIASLIHDANGSKIFSFDTKSCRFDYFVYHLFIFCRMHTIMASRAGSIIVTIIAAIVIIAILIFLVNVLAPIIVGIIIVLIIIGVAYWIYQQVRRSA
jgi:hypothetical protein